METYQRPTEQAGLCLADLGSCQKSLARLSLLICKGMTGRGQSPLLYRKKGPKSLSGGSVEGRKNKEEERESGEEGKINKPKDHRTRIW